ncbi:MAG TPA: hypothetical protein VH092_11860 [Urbifossiella sp.]|jgi:alpha-glucosidase|nr:hypothetical protein [Urbifossiella sp.]
MRPTLRRPCGLAVLALARASFAQAAPDAAPPPRPVVAGVSPEVRDRLKLDPFYQKYAGLDGLPILGSGKVSDAGLAEARYLIRQMLAERPDVLKEMARRGVRFVVMAPAEMTTDVPEQRNMTPKDYWDKRARGLGGKLTSCGEENLLNLKGDRYPRESILIHEFSHAVHRFGIGSLDRTFDVRLKEAYRAAADAGRWKDTYAATNHSEYWAEGVQSYFDCNAPPGKGVHNDVNTREKLARYDPDLFGLIDVSFGKNPWRYVRYDRRAAAGGQ